MRVLLTNDDGIEAAGSAGAAPGADAAARDRAGSDRPDGNRSAMARSITTRRPLWVRRSQFGDGTVGYATDGTPVDCVRLAHLGLIEGFEAELVVSASTTAPTWATTSPTRARSPRRFEAIVLGFRDRRLAAVGRLELDFRSGAGFDFSVAASFTARLVSELSRARRCPPATLLNINVPGGDPSGVEVARLGKRVYRDGSRWSTRVRADGGSGSAMEAAAAAAAAATAGTARSRSIGITPIG